METEVNVKTKEAAPAEPKPATRRVKHQQRLPWQRMALSIFGILVVVFKWHWDVNHLYVMPPAAYSAFVSITTNANYVIGAIVIFMISGKLIYDWKNQTTATVVEKAEHIFEKRDEKIEQVITMRTEGGAKAYAEDVE